MNKYLSSFARKKLKILFMAVLLKKMKQIMVKNLQKFSPKYYGPFSVLR